MRFMLYTIALLAMPVLCSAQKLTYADLPRGVRVNFETMFPNRPKSTWTMRDTATYMGNFMQDGRNVEVQYTRRGYWVLTSYDTTLTPPTAEIGNTLNTNWKGYVLKRVTRTVHPRSGSEAVWFIELEVGGKQVRAMLNPAGLLLWKQ